MSVAQLSQAKKSECGIAQPSSCIACDNINGEATSYDLARRRLFEGQKLADHTDTHTQTPTHTKQRMEAARCLKTLNIHTIPLHMYKSDYWKKT